MRRMPPLPLQAFILSPEFKTLGSYNNTMCSFGVIMFLRDMGLPQGIGDIERVHLKFCNGC